MTTVARPARHTAHVAAPDDEMAICGRHWAIWQLNLVNFERGLSQTIEATIFPLGADGIPLMLGCLEFLAEPLPPVPTVDKAVTAETSAIYEFIDIGAGVPELSV